MIELLGIPVSATRRKCALLNLKVVRGAVTGDDAGRPERRGAASVGRWRPDRPRYNSYSAAQDSQATSSEELHGHG